jgi:hypothetical protein
MKNHSTQGRESSRLIIKRRAAPVCLHQAGRKGAGSPTRRVRLFGSLNHGLATDLNIAGVLLAGCRRSRSAIGATRMRCVLRRMVRP